MTVADSATGTFRSLRLRKTRRCQKNVDTMAGMCYDSVNKKQTQMDWMLNTLEEAQKYTSESCCIP